MHTREEKLEQYGRLLDIMDTLREKCPWNRAQTNESLRPMTIEETYELSDAVLRKDSEDIKKELGDILLHVVFYAHIAEEKGRFDMADVASRECEKMIFRHPHIFGNGASEGLTEEEVAKNWELIKTKEKGGNRTILGGVPDSFPPVLKAYTLQDKASAVGFDWEKKEDVWDKVDEEIGEVKEAAGEDDPVHMEEEFGDAMFALVNAARLYGIDATLALDKACAKFKRRFTYLEDQTRERGLDLGKMTLAEMDEIWDEGKAKGL